MRHKSLSLFFEDEISVVDSDYESDQVGFLTVVDSDYESDQVGFLTVVDSDCESDQVGFLTVVDSDYEFRPGWFYLGEKILFVFASFCSLQYSIVRLFALVPFSFFIIDFFWYLY